MEPVIYETNEELQAATLEWQKRLRLQDWEIKSEIISSDHLSSAGRIDIFYDHTAAYIRMQPYADRVAASYKVFVPDMEHTLVHELVHIWMTRYKPSEGDVAFNVYEATIDQIAWALIRLKRMAIPGLT